MNTLFILIRPLRQFVTSVSLFGTVVELKAMDLVALGIIAILLLIHVVTVFTDARDYSKMDPKK